MPLSRRATLCAGAMLLSGAFVHAQTFTAAGGDIPDDGNSIDFPIDVSGVAAIDTSQFGLSTVCINATHTWISDLEFFLVAPDGTTVFLFGGVGGDTDAFTGTCLTGSATDNIADGVPPYTGDFRPQGQMGLVNNGQSGGGTWVLRVHDTYPGADQGALVDVSITFGAAPATYLVLHSSNLPIVLINTAGQTIPDDPKVDAAMAIIDNGPGVRNHPEDPHNGYDGFIGIETRGASSQSFPKKSYSLDLRNVFLETIDEPLLGMPTESDWVLYAPYTDKSMLNNALSYDLGHRMGHYAPRSRYVDVLLNGAYVGVYQLMEKIKRDGDRVDVATLLQTDTAGDELTGGYIVKVDRFDGTGWVSPFPPAAHDFGQMTTFTYVYPKAENIMPAQSAYIQAYVDSFETALSGDDFDDPQIGWRKYAGTGSTIDLLLVEELARNVDGYRLSSYLYKDKNSNGGKLRMGPLWDFDIAWGNADYCRGSDPTGWAYEFSDDCPDHGQETPFWWKRLMEDDAFVDSVRCRWNALRYTTLGVDRLHAWCDSVAAELEESQQRNYIVWPILGTYVWPNPGTVPQTYAGEVDEIKEWISARWAWIDQHLPGSCSMAAISENKRSIAMRVFPNPCSEGFTLTLPEAIDTDIQVDLIDALGRIRMHWALGRNDRPAGRYVELPQDLADGPYVVRVRGGGRTLSTPLVRLR